MAARTPHFVLSRTLRKVEWPNAKVLTGGVDGIADLKKQAGRDVVLWGGRTAAAAAIEAGVVDEYHFVTHPVIACALENARASALVPLPRRLSEKTVCSWE